jgi:hypothetical protein
VRRKEKIMRRARAEGYEEGFEQGFDAGYEQAEQDGMKSGAAIQNVSTTNMTTWSAGTAAPPSAPAGAGAPGLISSAGLGIPIRADAAIPQGQVVLVNPSALAPPQVKP